MIWIDRTLALTIQCIFPQYNTFINISVDWNILTKPIELDMAVQLQCDIKDENLCPGTPRWEGGPEHQIISIGNTVFDNKKYEISSSPGKYTLKILSITKEHLNSRFVCHVRFSKHGEILKDKRRKFVAIYLKDYCLCKSSMWTLSLYSLISHKNMCSHLKYQIR